MARNPDGSAQCDRCGIWLPGFGVLHGLVCVELGDGVLREWIFCYRNNCRSAMIGQLVRYPPHATETRCTECNVLLPDRSVATAMLASDIQPATPGDLVRYLTFCYVNGSRDLVLTNRTMA